MISTGWKLNIELDNHCVDTFVLDGQSNVVVSVCSNNSTQKCCDFSVSGLITLDNFYTEKTGHIAIAEHPAAFSDMSFFYCVKNYLSGSCSVGFSIINDFYFSLKAPLFSGGWISCKTTLFDYSLNLQVSKVRLFKNSKWNCKQLSKQLQFHTINKTVRALRL